MRENVKMLVFVTNVLTFSRFYKITTLYMKKQYLFENYVFKDTKVVGTLLL